VFAYFDAYSESAVNTFALASTWLTVVLATANSFTTRSLYASDPIPQISNVCKPKMGRPASRKSRKTAISLHRFDRSSRHSARWCRIGLLAARGRHGTRSWVPGSMGHLGHLLRPGHRVIILTRCETRVFPVFEKMPTMQNVHLRC